MLDCTVAAAAQRQLDEMPVCKNNVNWRHEEVALIKPMMITKY